MPIIPPPFDPQPLLDRIDALEAAPKFKGEWSQDLLVWSENFSGGVMPAELVGASNQPWMPTVVSKTDANIVAASALTSPPSANYVAQMYLERTGTVSITLDVAALGLPAANKIRYKRAGDTNQDAGAMRFFVNGVAAFADEYTAGTGVGWTTKTVNIDANDTVRWELFSNSGYWNDNRYWIAEIEILAPGEPYLQGDTVMYGGAMWKAGTDNPGEPGVSGWVQIPIT